MRKTLLYGAIALFTAGIATPCFAQDVMGAAGNEVSKAASKAARDAADRAAESAGLKTKSADKKHASTSTTTGLSLVGVYNR